MFGQKPMQRVRTVRRMAAEHPDRRQPRPYPDPQPAWQVVRHNHMRAQFQQVEPVHLMRARAVGIILFFHDTLRERA